MGNALDSPRRDKESESHITGEGLQGGATGMQGWRMEMEDSHILKEIPSAINHSMCAVFDGHGGKL